MADPLLSVRDLVTEFRSEGEGTVRAVNQVSFDVQPGETVGLVGESGSGKSVTMMSILGLVNQSNGRVVDGQAMFEGRDLLSLPDDEIRALRGGDLAMIFQDPMTSLNPVLTVGKQIAEAILTHQDISKAQARARTVELLSKVGVANPEGRYDDYPHEFSGGMRQRAMIAMAMANRPRLLIADEPTTALDVTVQAQVLGLLREAKDQANASTILITHDLGLVAEMADRVVVMYGGRVVEIGSVEDIFHEPRHPYTVGLLASLPRLEGDPERLQPIPGQPPSLAHLPGGCVFHPRCFLRQGREVCRREEPDLYSIEDPHNPRGSRCHFHEELSRRASGGAPARDAGVEGRDA
ncbi:MAG TPA: ABC transporter ATP-binding protein [Nocardioidaceae bacterium]|nr:ABC transporter ATP-binding protein [Nocardioidaceae bacterium]